jgi:hypothetical protein
MADKKDKKTNNDPQNTSQKTNLIEGSKVAYFPETTLPFERITSVHLQPLTATIC